MVIRGQVSQRGFEVVKSPKINRPTQLPTRVDRGSAGYDFYCKEQIIIAPHSMQIAPTDIKAFMQDDEVLLIHVRSSIGIKQGVTLANGTGVIDSTYYSNPDNDGNIMLALVNNTDNWAVIDAGSRVAQGVFQKYLTIGDNPEGARKGGIGSSGK